MKVIVYAICKNEEKFVERWVASMSEADGRAATPVPSRRCTTGKDPPAGGD